MTSIYEIHKVNRIGRANDFWTALVAQKWKASEEKFKEYTGSVPVTINANGSPLISWSIYGNRENGTPTPQNPVDVNGTGERTGNLFDEIYPSISGTVRYKPIYVGDGTFTLSTTTPYDGSVANVFLLSGDVSSGASTASNGAWLNHKVTAQSDNGYVTIAYRHYTGTTSPETCITMLSVGSTPQPYEPFGYKITISCGGTTTPVYLGEVETTRRVKKLVLTGEETFGYANRCFTLTFDGQSASVQPKKTIIFCNVYDGVAPAYRDVLCNYQCCIARNFNQLAIRDDNHANESGFKTYLQQQYAAGTPVTVWYVLATPQTAIVNEPLMRIGDYADEVSNVATIPTVNGSNTFDVETTVKPSEVYIKYKGR